jgi:hypothetical protein
MVLTAVVVCRAATDNGASNDDKLTKLLNERVELAERYHKACDVYYEAGQVTFDSLLAATTELYEAKLALCKTKAERIVVREKQTDLLKEYEKKIKALSDVQARGGEADKLYKAGVERVKAEIALELEKRDAASATK